LETAGVLLKVEEGIEDQHFLPTTCRIITSKGELKKGESLVYVKIYNYGGFPAIYVGENHMKVEQEKKGASESDGGQRQKSSYMYEQATIKHAKSQGRTVPNYVKHSPKRYKYAVPAEESLEYEAILTIAALIAWMNCIPDPNFGIPQVASLINRKILFKLTPSSLNRLKAIFGKEYPGKRLILEKRA